MPAASPICAGSPTSPHCTACAPAATAPPTCRRPAWEPPCTSPSGSRISGCKIGRASCRERVSVRVDLGGRRLLKKKKKKQERHIHVTRKDTTSHINKQSYKLLT